MSTASERNKMTLRRIYDEILTGGDDSLVDTHVAEYYVEHGEATGRITGRDAFKQRNRDLRRVLEGLSWKVEDLIAEGDRVAARVTLTGTHHTERMHGHVTGKQVRIPAMDIVRFSNGRMVERWFFIDRVGLSQQLGNVQLVEGAR